jgi:hypothetical protein
MGYCANTPIPITNPQSPIPNPQQIEHLKNNFYSLKKNNKKNNNKIKLIH